MPKTDEGSTGCARAVTIMCFVVMAVVALAAVGCVRIAVFGECPGGCSPSASTIEGSQ